MVLKFVLEKALFFSRQRTPWVSRIAVKIWHPTQKPSRIPNLQKNKQTMDMMSVSHKSRFLYLLKGGGSKIVLVPGFVSPKSSYHSLQGFRR